MGASIKIALVGPLPPPPGGVGSSIASIRDAVGQVAGVEVRVLGWRELWKLPFARPDVTHFNFSRPLKRLAGTLLGRLAGSIVVHTVHGNGYDFGRFGNAWAARLSHGFILLNPDVLARFRARGLTKATLLTPILSAPRPPAGTLEPALAFALAAHGGRIALAYAHSRQSLDGRDIYGLPFVADLLPHLASRRYLTVFLDPSGAYGPAEIDPHGTGAAIHHTRSVDFRALLAHTDLYLRPTSTDGSSVAVLEALDAGVPVLASDAVPRPAGALTYRLDDTADFLAKLDAVASPAGPGRGQAVALSSAADYLGFLRGLGEAGIGRLSARSGRA